MTRTCSQSKLLLIALLLALAAPLTAAAEVIDSGRWTSKGYEIAGGWSLVVEGDKRFVMLDEEFRTRKAPDLKLFFSPLPLNELNDRNAMRGAALIAPLERPDGAARYAIQPDVDLAAFQTLIIHCEQYSKLWGGAVLATSSRHSHSAEQADGEH